MTEVCQLNGMSTKQVMLARDAQLVAVDFESTGSVPGYPDEPWQIGVVPIDKGQVLIGRAYESYIQVSAERPFSPFAPGSWRLVRDRLADAPTLPDLLPILNARIMIQPLVAHNVSTEKKYFRKAWPLHRPGPWIDTLKLARMACPGMKDYSLDAVINRLEMVEELNRLLPGRTAHDALYDAAACALLLCHLLKQPALEKVTVDDLIRVASRRR